MIIKKEHQEQSTGRTYLRKLNKRFYSLIIDLKKSGFKQTSEIASFAYEHFWRELNQYLNIRHFN